MIQEIKIEGKNLDQLYNLDCVRSMVKTDRGLVVVLEHAINGWYARLGDSLRQNDDGSWEIIRQEEDQ